MSLISGLRRFIDAVVAIGNDQHSQIQDGIKAFGEITGGKK